MPIMKVRVILELVRVRFTVRFKITGRVRVTVMVRFTVRVSSWLT